MKNMKNLLLTILFTAVVLIAPQVVSAQTFNDKSDIYIGYQFVRENPDVVKPNFRYQADTDSNGFNVGYTYYFNNNKVAGLTTEVGVNFSRNNNILGTYLSGVTLKHRNSKVQPFARALIGVASQKAKNEIFNSRFNKTNTGLAFALGGGLDVKVSKNTALRIFQVDYLQTRVFNTTQNNLRIGAGITF